MDGVLADYMAGVYEKWHTRYPEMYAEHAIPLDSLPRMYTRNCYEGDVFTTLHSIEHEAGMFAELPPVPGAIAAAQALAATYDVRICTKPRSYEMGRCMQEKAHWIAQHLGEEWLAKTIFTRDKTLVRAAILIDDNPHITEGAYTPEWQHIVYDRPYNRHLADTPRISWDMEWKSVLKNVL